MTREEAVAIIRKEYSCVGRDCDIERSCGKCDLVMPSKEPILEAYKMAIKALEQEPILDKIRAEIEEEYGDYDICEWFADYDYEENDISEYRSVGDVSDILEIIDKYKAESEDKE